MAEIIGACRENALTRLKDKIRRYRDTARQIEKFVEFLEHWQELNGKLDKDIEELLWRMSNSFKL